MNCPNCHAHLNCGCQKRKASNGAICCSSCIGAYESKLRAAKQVQPKPRSEGATMMTASATFIPNK